MVKHSTSSTSKNNKPIIALDCDGVLLDFHAGYAQIYEKTFGKQLTPISPKSCRAETRYGINFNDEEHTQFDKVWKEHAWRTMPMEDGALEACLLLHEAGYELVCVTAMSTRHIEDRLENFRSHGFPIDKIIGIDYDKANGHNNLKKETIENLHPIVFVDDLRKNFQDIQGVHTKLIFIDHEYHDEPNRHDNIYYDVKYSSLLEFVKDFLRTEDHGKDVKWSDRPSHLIPSNTC